MYPFSSDQPLQVAANVGYTFAKRGTGFFPKEPAAACAVTSTPITDFVGVWSLVYVQPRCERLAASIMIRDGVQCYLPLYVDERKYEKGFVYRPEKPLFDRYVFVCGDPAGLWYDVISRRTIGGDRIVSMTIAVVDQAKFVRELHAVSIAVSEGAIKPYTMPVEGDVCVCVSGVWEGRVGRIGKQKNSERIEFITEVLNRPMSIMIQPHLLEVCEPERAEKPIKNRGG